MSARLKRNRASTPIHTRTENVCGALSDGRCSSFLCLSSVRSCFCVLCPSDDEGLEVPGFDFERVREDLSGCLMGGFGANDIMGFDPLGGTMACSCVQCFIVVRRDVNCAAVLYV